MRTLALILGLAGLGTVAMAQEVASAPGAMLRGLDKVATDTTDLDLAVGQSATYGRLDVRLGDCRYPVDDPDSDAYAYLTIRDRSSGEVLFDGWMIASSPALSALDHPRYDVWVIRCNSSDAEGTGGTQ
ncbi:hypothetical protein LV82_01251 [Albidovulum inexpectatum]|uniref:DUF2155 domain-containing protein n=1 Tax=Albidovulum inexpectatum TaxID=196587 RepID=A0A2S5JIM7_9RHOB|nr:DUF2155 domain-containing protein [Albidovulum inexpectatum]PPB81208.1 hypothetical protein LV82_01251 [Albidovulum inexpectatum]